MVSLQKNTATTAIINNNIMKVHIDKFVGIAGEKIYWMRSANGKKHWCKMAIAIMGSFNMSEKERATISPFDPKFHDNFVEGKGATKEEALSNMEINMKEMADSLWF